MKKAIVIFLAVCCIFMTACGKKEGTPTDDGFRDDSTGISYTMCNFLTLSAIEKGEKYLSVNNEDFYEVEYEDPKRFLCTEDEDGLLLYRAEDVKEPDVYSFRPISAAVFVNNQTFITYFYADDKYLPEDKRGLNPTQDTALCQSMAEALKYSQEMNVPAESIRDEDVYYIRLFSKDYPGLYYLVVFFGDDTGRFYLRDRGMGKTVICPDEVKERMVG